MTKNTESTIRNLFKHELAATEVCKEALGHIENNYISQQVSKFLDNHEKHVEELSQTLKNLTGSLPERKTDLKGALLSGYASLRSMTGQKGALNALETTENIVLNAYKDASKQTFEPNINNIIKNNLSEEERRYKYIKNIMARM